jgi:ribosomal protein S18 acetylase RimI-like enzyme
MPSSNSNINSSSSNSNTTTTTTNNNNNNNKHCNSTPTSNIDGDVLDDTNNDNRSALKIVPCRNNSNRKNNITHPPPPPTTARDETASLLISDPSIHPRMFYIMTLGTARNFRRYGLGSMLIESIITMIENEGTSTSTSSSTSSMGLEENDTYETAMQKGRALAMVGRPTQLTGVLYLHVIIYNTGAIRMYERLGFVRVKEIQGK